MSFYDALQEELLRDDLPLPDWLDGDYGREEREVLHVIASLDPRPIPRGVYTGRVRRFAGIGPDYRLSQMNAEIAAFNRVFNSPPEEPRVVEKKRKRGKHDPIEGQTSLTDSD